MWSLWRLALSLSLLQILPYYYSRTPPCHSILNFSRCPSPRHDASPHATLNSPLRILISFRIHFRNKLSLPCCNENFQTELCRSVHGVVSFATSMLLETQFLTTRKLYFHAHFLSIISCSPSFYSSSSSALGPKVKFCTAAKGLQTVNSAPSVLPSRHACDPRFSPFPYHLAGLQKQRPFSLRKDEEASHGHGGDWPHQHYEDVRSFRRRGRRHVLCGQLLSCPAARHCLQRNTGFR